MELSKELSKLCTPALIYFVLSVIGIGIALFNRFRFVTILVKVLFVLLWTWVLNFLCKKGFTVLSWILVVLPFLMVLGMVSIAIDVTANVPNVYNV